MSTLFEPLEPVAIIDAMTPLLRYHMTALVRIQTFSGGEEILSGILSDSEIIPGIFSDSSSPKNFPNYARHNFRTPSVRQHALSSRNAFFVSYGRYRTCGIQVYINHNFVYILYMYSTYICTAALKYCLELWCLIFYGDVFDVSSVGECVQSPECTSNRQYTGLCVRFPLNLPLMRVSHCVYFV